MFTKVGNYIPRILPIPFPQGPFKKVSPQKGLKKAERISQPKCPQKYSKGLLRTLKGAPHQSWKLELNLDLRRRRT